MPKHQYKPVGRIAMQGKRGKSEFPNFDRYSCSACQIDYHVRSGVKAICPLCDAKKEIEALQQEVSKVRGANSTLQQDYERLEVQVNTLTAMKDAITLISDDDMMIVKSVAYRWRDERSSIAMLPLVQRSTRAVQGFEIRPRGEPAEEYVCNSVGGMALASCYAEAVKMAGSVKAMEMLLRAIAWKLTSA